MPSLSFRRYILKLSIVFCSKGFIFRHRVAMCISFMLPFIAHVESKHILCRRARYFTLHISLFNVRWIRCSVCFFMLGGGFECSNFPMFTSPTLRDSQFEQIVFKWVETTTLEPLKILSFHTKPGLLFGVISDFLTTNTQAKNALVMLVSWSHSNPAFASDEMQGVPRVSGLGFWVLETAFIHASYTHTIHDPWDWYIYLHEEG